MALRRAWLDRLELLEEAIERGEVRVQDIIHPPAAPSFEDVRNKVSENPPLEGQYIAGQIFATPVPFILMWTLTTLVGWLLFSRFSGPPPEGTGNQTIGHLVAGIALGLFPAFFLTATAQSAAPWLLDNIFKPTDIEAATKRAYDIAMIEQARRELARADWLMGQSFDAWSKADGPTFERLTAREFRRQGWKVQTVGGANDGGVDLRLRKEKISVLVQCKAHAKPMTPAVVRELYGAMIHEKADGAILVCLSGATKAANNWILGKPMMIVTPEQLIARRKFPNVPGLSF